MKNTISQRVADFLKNFPPFNGLKINDLQLLSEEINILYKEKDSIIFSEKETGHSHFYVVHKGATTCFRK